MKILLRFLNDAAEEIIPDAPWLGPLDCAENEANALAESTKYFERHYGTNAMHRTTVIDVVTVNDRADGHEVVHYSVTTYWAK